MLRQWASMAFEKPKKKNTTIFILVIRLRIVRKFHCVCMHVNRISLDIIAFVYGDARTVTAPACVYVDGNDDGATYKNNARRNALYFLFYNDSMTFTLVVGKRSAVH